VNWARLVRVTYFGTSLSSCKVKMHSLHWMATAAAHCIILMKPWGIIQLSKDVLIRLDGQHVLYINPRMFSSFIIFFLPPFLPVWLTDGELYAGVYIDFMGTDSAIFRTLGKQTAMRTDQYNSRWLNGNVSTHSLDCIRLYSFTNVSP